MILLNFGPKMQKTGFDQFNALTGKKITEQISLPIEFNDATGFIQELDRLFAKVNLTSEDLKQDRLVLLPPPNSYAAIVLVLELFYRTGSYPYLIRTRPQLYGLQMGSDVAEVIDLEQDWSRLSKS